MEAFFICVLCRFKAVKRNQIFITIEQSMYYYFFTLSLKF